MRVLRELWRRLPVLIGLLICLTSFGFTAVLGVDCVRTGVAAGKYGARYYRAEGDPFYYFTVAVFGVGSVFWLGLAVLSVVVLIRWKDWM
ncbi:hypothetical protein ACETK8_19135 [Brevundimonas staleyi]|uniref:Uncharacterized protein n=1 Tax=Brevundimonas staleyi TaxID=74326 RepID=A0ABW0FQP0_9CAUL